MPSPNKRHIPGNIWSLILNHLSGRELAQVYATNSTVRNAINTNFYKRWQAARNLHHKANLNIYANLTRLRNQLNNASPAKRKNIQTEIRKILNEQNRRAKKRG